MYISLHLLIYTTPVRNLNFSSQRHICLGKPRHEMLNAFHG